MYLTNAVKHFKWKRQGKVRLHKKPNAEEVRACAAWWRAELELVAPEIVVLLGATAAQAALGSKVRVTRDRGVVIPAGDALPYDALVTLHPSAVLRMRDPEREEAFDGLVRDLREAADHVGNRVSAAPKGEVRIGCSGWVYRDWRGVVYPEALPQRRGSARTPRASTPSRSTTPSTVCRRPRRSSAGRRRRRPDSSTR